jgi:hypothetical protein
MEHTERIRGRRVRFKHPVRVTMMDGEPKAWRTLAANLSSQGVFVRMPQPLQPGTRVAIALEAGGQAFPLARGEVRWVRGAPSEAEDEFPGCGVAFTDFLHPRAGELVEYLVATLETGKPLKTAPYIRRMRVLRSAAYGAGLLLSAALVAFMIEVGTAASAPDEDEVALPVVTVVPTRVPEPTPAPAPGSAPPATANVATAPASELEELAPLALPSSPPATSATSMAPAAAVAPTSGSVPAPEPAPVAIRAALPSGAARAVAWRATPDGVEVKVDPRSGALVKHVFALANPARLVLELSGPLPQRSFASEAHSGAVSRVRMARHGKFTRLVLDFDRPIRHLTPQATVVLVHQ